MYHGFHKNINQVLTGFSMDKNSALSRDFIADLKLLNGSVS